MLTRNEASMLLDRAMRLHRELRSTTNPTVEFAETVAEEIRRLGSIVEPYPDLVSKLESFKANEL